MPFFGNNPNQVNRNAASNFFYFFGIFMSGIVGMAPCCVYNALSFKIWPPQSTCGMTYFFDNPTQVNRNAASGFFCFWGNLRCGIGRKCPILLLKYPFFLFYPLKYLWHEIFSEYAGPIKRNATGDFFCLLWIYMSGIGGTATFHIYYAFVL